MKYPIYFAQIEEGDSTAQHNGQRGAKPPPTIHPQAPTTQKGKVYLPRIKPFTWPKLKGQI